MDNDDGNFQENKSSDITEGKEKNKSASESTMEDIDTGRDYGNSYGEKFKIVKSRRNRYFFIMIWTVLLIFISVLITRYVLAGINDMLAIGRDNTIATLDIPENANLNGISKLLKDNGVISEQVFFKMYAVVTKAGSGFSQGVFELKRNMDYEEVLSHIRNKSNNKDIIEITFREGRNVMEYANLLEEKGVCNKDEFLKMCNSDQFDAKYGFLSSISNKSSRYYKLEGYLFPDTYQFYRNENAGDSADRFLSNFERKVIKQTNIKGYEQKVSIEELANQSGSTLENVLNIASMIQAEAANNSDMYKVSSVIHNRVRTLPSGGKSPFGEYGLGYLGIDSTVWYPYRTKALVPRDILDSFKSRYDTYSIEGMPPGPICNPGTEALLAAITPENTSYYYFCHSASGEAYYAKNNDVHMSNLRRAGLI